MQITAIEEKRKGLSAVYIDGEYAMKLDQSPLGHSFVSFAMRAARSFA